MSFGDEEVDSTSIDYRFTALQNQIDIIENTLVDDKVYKLENTIDIN